MFSIINQCGERRHSITDILFGVLGCFTWGNRLFITLMPANESECFSNGYALVIKVWTEGPMKIALRNWQVIIVVALMGMLLVRGMLGAVRTHEQVALYQGR